MSVSIHCPVLGYLREDQEDDCGRYGCIGAACKHPSLNKISAMKLILTAHQLALCESASKSADDPQVAARRLRTDVINLLGLIRELTSTEEKFPPSFLEAVQAAEVAVKSQDQPIYYNRLWDLLDELYALHPTLKPAPAAPFPDPTPYPRGYAFAEQESKSAERSEAGETHENKPREAKRYEFNYYIGDVNVCIIGDENSARELIIRNSKTVIVSKSLVLIKNASPSQSK